MIMSQEKALFKAKKKFEQMEAAVRRAAADPTVNPITRRLSVARICLRIQGSSGVA